MESRSLGWAVGDKRAKRVGSFGGRLKVVLYSAVYKRKKAQANFGKKTLNFGIYLIQRSRDRYRGSW